MEAPISDLGRMVIKHMNTYGNRKWMESRKYNPLDVYFWYKKDEKQSEIIFEFIDELIFLEQDLKIVDELIEFRNKCKETLKKSWISYYEGWDPMFDVNFAASNSNGRDFGKDNSDISMRSM